MRRAVVITGVGSVSALGVGTGPLWEGLCAGRSGLGPITVFDPGGFDCRLAGQVPEGFSVRDFVPKHYRKATKVMARDIELAIAAAKEAVDDAGLVTRGTLPEDSTDPTTYPPSRLGCHIGAGLISAEADELAAALVTARSGDGTVDLGVWGARGMENLTPLWMLKYLPNMLACHVTIIHGCEGPSNTITCAEASGLLSIGESVRVIERGSADACVCGGGESKLNLMGLLRSELAGRAAPTGDERDGSRLLRPFDAGSAGGLIGEAAGIMMVESVESARGRGARVYAQIAGCGAGHSPRRGVLAGERDNVTDVIDEGVRAAVENALGDARVRPEQIDAVVTLGGGIPAMDLPEANALRAVLGARMSTVPLVTIGPNIGNCWAGSGAMVAVVAAMCVREQRLPARLHAGTPAPGILAGACDSREAKLGHVLAISSSLGGQNAALVLRAV